MTAPPAPGAAALHVEDVYKSYGSRHVLDNVDLKVDAGELCALVGPSGCGKSTLFRLILGQERPTRGVINVHGEPVGPPGIDRGVVYQRYSLFPHLTVMRNVTLGKWLTTPIWARRRRRKEFEEEAMRLLEAVGLERCASQYPHQLSGGMQQRVAVVQSLIMRPKVLLMDEPFGALDPGTREDLQVFLLELWTEFRMTVVFVTHDLEEAVFVGSRLVVLSQYYTDDRGDAESVKRGAKVVADYELKVDRKALPTSEKCGQAFAELIARVRLEGFEPSSRQHVRDFNLKHPRSFRTLRPEELHS